MSNIVVPIITKAVLKRMYYTKQKIRYSFIHSLILETYLAPLLETTTQRPYLRCRCRRSRNHPRLTILAVVAILAELSLLCISSTVIQMRIFFRFIFNKFSQEGVNKFETVRCFSSR